MRWRYQYPTEEDLKVLLYDMVETHARPDPDRRGANRAQGEFDVEGGEGVRGIGASGVVVGGCLLRIRSLCLTSRQCRRASPHH
jgi:hypothetical protein